MADHDVIYVLNRAQIFDDFFNLAKVGIVQYQDVIDIICYLKTEKKTLNFLQFHWNNY